MLLATSSYTFYHVNRRYRVILVLGLLAKVNIFCYIRNLFCNCNDFAWLDRNTYNKVLEIRTVVLIWKQFGFIRTHLECQSASYQFCTGKNLPSWTLLSGALSFPLRIAYSSVCLLNVSQFCDLIVARYFSESIFFSLVIELQRGSFQRF